jgi:hypothetical protein
MVGGWFKWIHGGKEPTLWHLIWFVPLVETRNHTTRKGAAGYGELFIIFKEMYRNEFWVKSWQIGEKRECSEGIY